MNKIKLQLDARLPEPIPEATWSLLVDTGAVAKVEMGEKDIDWLMGVCAQMGIRRRALEPARMLPTTKGPRSDARQAALSTVLAAEAAKTPPVEEFREDVLKGKVLGSAEQAEDWAGKHWKADGPPTLWLRDIPVPPGVQPTKDERTGRIGTDPPIQIDGDLGAERCLLRDVPIGFTGEPFTAFTAEHGTLDRLRRVVEELRQEYPWTATEAALFVLTDMIPAVQPIKLRMEDEKKIPACRRIVLEIDPTVTPRHLRDYYRRARRQLWGQRIRNLSEKHLRLAEFWAHGVSEADVTPQMKVWNRRNPEWRYKNAAIFRRDSLQARSRILGLHMRPPVIDVAAFADIGYGEFDAKSEGWPFKQPRRKRVRRVASRRRSQRVAKR